MASRVEVRGMVLKGRCGRECIDTPPPAPVGLSRRAEVMYPFRESEEFAVPQVS